MDGQEGLRHESALQFGGEEIRHVAPDARRRFRHFAEPAGLVRRIGVHHGHDLFRVHLDHRRADAVGGAEKGQGIAVGRVFGLIDVVHPAQHVRVEFIQFDDDLVRHVGVGRGGTHRGSERDLARVRDVAGLDDRIMHRSEEAVAHILRGHGKMHVEELRPALVDALAQLGAGLVGRAELHRIRQGQRPVQRLAGGRPGQHADLEGFAFRVQFFGPFPQRARDVLRRPRRSEPAESHGLAVLDKFRRFRGRQYRIMIHDKLFFKKSDRRPGG